MEVWVDFKAVKQAVSIEQLVTRYGITLRKVNATSLRGRCPLPVHGSKDSRQSFTVNTAKNVWSCLSASCVTARGGSKGGNTLDLVAAMEQCSIRDAALKIAEWFSLAVSTEAPKQSHQEPPPGGQEPQEPAELVAKRKEPAPDPAPDGRNKPLTFTLRGIDPDHPYLAARGITREAADTFGVGFFPGKGSVAGRVVIPIHDETGALVAYAGRAIDDTEPRYKFPAGFHKSHVLFNLNRTSEQKTIVVVEGFFGCMRVVQAGFPAVALMGSSLSAEQEDLLCNHFSGAVLLFDGDDAGKAATDDCLLKIGRRIWVRAIMLGLGEQPDTLTAERIVTLVEG
jgi:DNA primase